MSGSIVGFLSRNAIILNFALFLIATSFLSWTLHFLSEISLQSFQSHWASAVSQDLIITCKGCQLVSLLLRLQHQLIITHSTDQSIKYSALTKHWFCPRSESLQCRLLDTEKQRYVYNSMRWVLY